MKVNLLLLRSCVGLGKHGDVVTVKYGYAVNFLIPNGVAVYYDSSSIVTNVVSNNSYSSSMEKIISKVESIWEKVKLLSTISISVAANQNGVLYSSIRECHVVACLESKIGYCSNKMHGIRVCLPNPFLKRVGTYSIVLKYIILSETHTIKLHLICEV